MAKNPQARKRQITINNPVEKGYDHERIKTELEKLKSVIYWCLADEIDIEEQPPHTHIFLSCSSSPIRFSTIKNLFEAAHIEAAKGSAQQNRDYIAKTGKCENDPKRGTIVEETFNE